MKKLVYVILGGAATFALVLSMAVGCGSTDKVGGKAGGGGAGSTGAPIIKLDGSTTGKGGSGGSGAAPTDDANCGKSKSSTSKEPPDVLIVLDRSSSMAWSIAQDNCYCSQADIDISGTTGSLCADTSNCSSRWSAVKPAVAAAVSNATDVQWGLKFFQTPGASAQCTVSSTMEVPIAADSATAVQSAIDSANLSLSTPTAAALKAATAYLKTVNDNRPKFILLATDGEPNCGGARPSINTDDITGATQAATDAKTAGFPVYVVGIGPNPGNLTQLAQSGGTEKYYSATSADELTKALSEISKLVASCTFTFETTPPDINNIAVYVDKNLVQKGSNGWTLGANNQSVVLQGDTCNKITSGQATTVEILFGCPGQAPPQNIP